MTYVAPSTRAVGYLVTAANWNQDVADNIIAIHDSEGVRAYHNTTQSVNSSTSTPLSLNSERYDTAAQHSTVTNTSRLTCQQTGVYVICGSYNVASGGSNRYIAEILLNGTTVIAQNGTYNNTTSQYVTIAVCTLYRLTSGDYVQLQAYQTSGSAQTVAADSNFSPEFAMQWMGRGA